MRFRPFAGATLILSGFPPSSVHTHFRRPLKPAWLGASAALLRGKIGTQTIGVRGPLKQASQRVRALGQAASALTGGSRSATARKAWKRRSSLIRLSVRYGSSKIRVLAGGCPGVDFSSLALTVFLGPARIIVRRRGPRQGGARRLCELLDIAGGRTGKSEQKRRRLARMASRMASSAPPPLRQALNDRISQLIEEAECLASSEIARQAGEAGARARRETADRLNQAVRRLRQASSPEEVGAALADAAGAFASGVALFRLEGETAIGERIGGAAEPASASFKDIRIPLSEAAALEAAAKTGDPVVAAATAAQISAPLAHLLGHSPESRVSIFPVAGPAACEALLYAWGAVEGPALELLAQAAGAFWSGRPAPALDEEPAQIITIAPAPEAEPEAAPSAPASSWDRLSPEDRRLHLRAQRFARVQTAEMRLRHATEVQAGRVRRNLYSALRQPIDAAREAFRKNFFGPCPSMVDYLHLELVRTLANEDPALLGKDYPGILA